MIFTKSKSNKSDFDSENSQILEDKTPHFTEYELHILGELNQGIAMLSRNIARLDKTIREQKMELESNDDSDGL